MKRFCILNSVWIVFTFWTPHVRAEAVHGIVTIAKGSDINVKRNGHQTFAPLKVGMKVFPGDAVMTGKESIAKIVMIDKNVISVSPDTVFAFEKYEYDSSRFEKNVLLNLSFGKIRSIVQQRYDGKDSKYQIKTPSAVAGVHGTDFLTSYDVTTNETQVVTFEGGVAFSKLEKNGSMGPSVSVLKGAMASNKIDGAPMPAKTIPESELKHMNDSSLPREPASMPNEATDGASHRVPAHSPVYLTSQDLGQCENCASEVVGPTLELGGFPPQRAQSPDAANCEFCVRAIEDGNTAVNINLIPVGP